MKTKWLILLLTLSSIIIAEEFGINDKKIPDLLGPIIETAPAQQ